MGNKKQVHLLKDQLGQSTVEYVLLLAVVSSLFFSVFKSDTFQQFFGENSSFFNAIAEKMRLDYRYSTAINASDDIGPGVSANHPSFSQPDGSASRFFSYKSGLSYPP